MIPFSSIAGSRHFSFFHVFTFCDRIDVRLQDVSTASQLFHKVSGNYLFASDARARKSLDPSLQNVVLAATCRDQRATKACLTVAIVRYHGQTAFFPLQPHNWSRPATTLDGIDLILSQPMSQFELAVSRFVTTYRVPADETTRYWRCRGDTYDTAMAAIYLMER